MEYRKIVIDLSKESKDKIQKIYKVLKEDKFSEGIILLSERIYSDMVNENVTYETVIDINTLLVELTKYSYNIPLYLVNKIPELREFQKQKIITKRVFENSLVEMNLLLGVVGNSVDYENLKVDNFRLIETSRVEKNSPMREYCNKIIKTFNKVEALSKKGKRDIESVREMLLDISCIEDINQYLEYLINFYKRNVIDFLNLSKVLISIIISKFEYIEFCKSSVYI